MSGQPWPSLWRIEHSKISNYLLNLNHPKGGPKARFWLAFGFDPSNPGVMAQALASHAWENAPGTLKTPLVGPPRLVFEGTIDTPDMRDPIVRTVWELEDPNTARFLTAYPHP